jgi:hypothetical protein
MIMKNTMIATVGSLVLASTLAILAVAQAKPAKPVFNVAPAARVKVNLKCTPNFNSDVATQVAMENNSGAQIAAGTMLYWQTNAGIKGTVKLSAALPVNQKVSGIHNVPSNSSSCTAYFVK